MARSDFSERNGSDSQFRLQQPAGKYSSEAFGFIQLLRQTGRSLFGLAILELAWLGAVHLLEGLNPTGVSSISLPFGAGIDILDLGFYGMFVVAAVWATTVYGLPAILWFRAAGTYVLVVVGALLVPILVVINLLIFPILLAVEAAINRRQINQVRSRLARHTMAKSENINGYIAVIRRSHRWVRWALLAPVFRLFTPQALKQPRKHQIALTPFKAFGLFETTSAKVDPREVLQRTLLRVQTVTPSVRDIRARSVSARKPFAARAIVGPYGILLGGRHLDPVLPLVTIFSSQSSRLNGVADISDKTFSDSLFPEQLEFDRPPITLDLRNTAALDLAILIPIAGMIFRRPTDELGSGHDISGHDMMLEIAARCRGIAEPIDDTTFSAEGQAARLSGAWVGHIIARGRTDPGFVSAFWEAGVLARAHFMLEVVQGCIKGQIDVIQNLFRLGAINCILKDIDAAIDAFDRAIMADPAVDPREGRRALSLLQVMGLAQGESGLMYARAAAYGCCAIGLGLHKEVYDIVSRVAANIDPNNGPPPGLEVLRRCLMQKDISLDLFCK